MNQMSKFEATIGKLHIRIADLKPRLLSASTEVDAASAANQRPVALDASLASIRRDCADILIALKSLFELIASAKPKPDPVLLQKLQTLKYDHESMVNELAEIMARSGKPEKASGSAEPAPGHPSLSKPSVVVARVPSVDLQTALDIVLDREASLRAQYDLLVLKVDRLEKVSKQSGVEKVKLQRALELKEGEYAKTLAKLTHDLETTRAAHELKFEAALKYIGFLTERTKSLDALMDAYKPALSQALQDELQLFKQEEEFLNLPLAKVPSQTRKSIAKQVRLIKESGLFDPEYYKEQFSQPFPDGADLLVHYVTEGWRAGKNPQSLFSVPFYLMRNQELVADGVEPLGHYIEFGSAELRDPHPLFSTAYYSRQVGAPASGTWLGHFLEVGPSPPSPHPLFDVESYSTLVGLPNVHSAIALIHYVTTGWLERKFAFRPPFDVAFYEAQFGEALGMEPYLHFALFGATHGVSPHPLFSTREYLDAVADLDPMKVDPLLHYFLKGEEGGILPSPFFAPKFYRAKYLAGEDGTSPLQHYLTKGAEQLHDPHPYFNAAIYLDLARKQNADLKQSVVSNHLLTGGLQQLQSDTVVGFFKNLDVDKFKNLGNGKAPAPEKAQKPAATGSFISRQYPGKIAYRDDAPNVLIIAHVAGDHLFGSERSFLDMVDAVGKIPSNLYVVLPRNVPDYTNALRPLCHRVYIVDYKWWRKGESVSDISIQAFEHLIRSDNIDAVHVNTIMLREPLEAARKCNVAGIVHVRELIQYDQALQDLIGETPDEIIRQTKARADWVIGNSDITALAFAKEGRTFTIPNTIDVDVMDIANPLGDDEIRFGLISSNVPKKGIADVVELAKMAATRAKKAKFVIIGPENDLVAELKRQQASGDVPNNIVFPGYATSPRKAIEQVNVVLNFSHFAESFGRTVLEAMAARRPVIAYRWGALPELVDHGKSGYLVDFKQVADALPYIEKLCKNPEMIKELGARGREIAVSRFALDSYRVKIAEAYAKIVPPRSKRELLPAVVKPARLPGLKTQEDRPRIAYFCWHFPVPSETFVLNELEALVAAGADVRVFCRQTPWKDFKPTFPITFERVDSPKKLAQRLKETDRTIVHAHFVYPVVTDMVWPACEEAQIPFTFIAHAQDIFRYENDQKNRLSEIGQSKWCRAMFTLSKFHLDFVVERGFPREKVVINPNAVDTRRFSAAYDEEKQNRSAKKIISVHRFVKKKGIDLLIRAAPLVADLGVKIEIYGYGDQEDEYRRLITEIGATNVEIMGALSQDEIIGKMKTADLFAAPSVRIENGDMDGIPTSVVESMAAGVPVITTNVAGIPDLVIDEVTGIMVEPTPESVADGIRRYYSMPSLKVRSIIRAAARRARERHDVVNLTRVLMRVWRNQTIDLIIVSWNNLAELEMVVDRIVENTSLPYHLIICDNQSRREPVPAYLDGLWEKQDRVTVIHNNSNAMVGPGTNAALAQGNSDYAVYICGKEGVSFGRGWEIPVVHALDEQPDVGLVGTIGYSPTYLHGAQLPTGIELFPKFRNREFALENPNRIFGHVQGGLFGMRRKMVDEIGGFSDDVPHNYTDVEYSYYAESKGWKLGTAPSMLALFNKSRPTLSQRFDETVVVAHPVLPDELSRYDAVSNGRLKHCNLCDWFGEAFHERDLCPSCGSGPEDRTIYRWLSEGILMYRRLPALAVGLTGRLEKEWAAQFQGARMAVHDMVAELAANGRLPNRPGTFHLSLIRCEPAFDELDLVARELKRLLLRGGTALFQVDTGDGMVWQQTTDRLVKAMEAAGFRSRPDVLYASKAVGYSFTPVNVFERI